MKTTPMWLANALYILAAVGGFIAANTLVLVAYYQAVDYMTSDRTACQAQAEALVRQIDQAKCRLELCKAGHDPSIQSLCK